MSEILDPARGRQETAPAPGIESIYSMEISPTMNHPLQARTATLAALALALTLAGPAAAGLVFTQETTAEGEAAKYLNMTMRAWIDTGGMKMEFLSSGNPLMAAGSYMLIQPDADAMLLVNPKDKTYTNFDFNQLMGSMSQMTGGESGGGKREVADPIVEKLFEEDGGTILGRPTRHFRWRTRYTTRIAAGMGLEMETATDQTEDVWVADLKIDPKIMRSFEGMGAGVALPADMQKVVEAAKQTQKGFPLKRVVVATSKTTTTGTGMMAKMMAKSMTNQDGEKPTNTTYVVTELSEEKVPASMFAIPPGYTETEMMAPGMKMPDMKQQP